MSFIRRHLYETSDSIKKCDVVFICSDADRGVMLSGKAYSPILDSIRDDFEKRGLICTSLQYPWAEYFGGKGYGNPLSINRSYFMSRLKDKAFKFFFGSKSGKYISPSIIDIYKKLIDKAKPKCIICIGAPIELCLAAHRSNVLLVELLHGMGFTFTPWDYDLRLSEELPDVFLSFDAVSSETFSRFNDRGKITLRVPHPFLKRFINRKLRALLPDEWLPNIGLKPEKKIKKQILFSLQWGYAGDHGKEVQFENILDNGLFPGCIEQLISEDESILWRFRLHPLQMRLSKYKSLVRYLDKFCQKRKNCEWKISSYLPLPSVLAISSGHISMTSMSAYEAAYMGVPSLMLCPTLQKGGIYEKYFSDLENSQFVTKATSDIETIRLWVNSVTTKPPFEGGFCDEDAWERAISLILNRPNFSR